VLFDLNTQFQVVIFKLSSFTHVLLSQEELGKWIIPQDYDPIEAEAAHLIYEADTNKVCVVIL